MRERLRGVTEGRRGRILLEVANWLPALGAMALFVAHENLLFFTYGMAYTLWVQFRAFRGTL